MAGNNAEAMDALRRCLEQTFSPDANVRKAAENYLKQGESSPGFCILVLHVVEGSTTPEMGSIRQAAAVLFKNLVKRHWDAEKGDSNAVITDAERIAIKSNLVTLMCNVPDQIQKQLSEALSTIGKYDFPHKWENLLPELISKLNSDWRVINGVLQTANTIFKRFRYVFRSDELYKELSHCLTQFQQPLLDMTKLSRAKLQEHANDKATLVQIVSAIRTMCRIFFSLNWQDIPAFFEDHIQEWMEEFGYFLQYSNPLLEDASEEDEAGPIDLLQQAVVENINVYAEKYEDEFKPFIEKFAETIWNLLSKKITKHPKHDMLSATCMKFLRAMALQPKNKTFFEQPNALQEICTTIVVPNLLLRTSDEELFEDNPMDFIRRDIEGSDGDTRRSAARELVRGLLRNFHGPVTQICLGLVQGMMTQFASDPVGKWQVKDVSINLIIALAVQKQSRALGVSEINPGVPIMEFFTAHILPELQTSASASSMLLKADAIKFVSTFRNQLTQDMMVQIVPMLISMFIPDQFVVHTYAASCLERILTVKSSQSGNGQKELRFSKAHLQPHLLTILQGLFGILEQPNYPENDYLMKAVMRVMNVAKEDIVPVTDTAVTKLTSILKRICANPSNPIFAHYLFEAISVLVNNVCRNNPANIEKFEGLLFQPFQSVLIADVEALCPYVYQVLAQLLELRTQGVSEAYMNMFPILLAPALWERVSNVTALAKLLEAYIRKSPEQISKYLEGILGVFQKLVSTKVTESNAFVLLRALFGYLPLQVYQKFAGDIFQILMHRLQARLNTRMSIIFIKDLLYTMSVFIGKNGAIALLEALEAIQPGMGIMLVQQVWLPNFMKVRGKLERKTVAVGMNRILCEAPAVKSNPELWISLLNGILQFFEDTQVEEQPKDADEQLLELEETGYEAGFSKLYFASSKTPDLLEEFPSAKHHLVSALSELSKANPGTYSNLVSTRMEAKPKAVLESFFATAQLPFQ